MKSETPEEHRRIDAAGRGVLNSLLDITGVETNPVPSSLLPLTLGAVIGTSAKRNAVGRRRSSLVAVSTGVSFGEAINLLFLVLFCSHDGFHESLHKWNSRSLYFYYTK